MCIYRYRKFWPTVLQAFCFCFYLGKVQTESGSLQKKRKLKVKITLHTGSREGVKNLMIRASAERGTAI